jgi:hypothetical protein
MCLGEVELRDNFEDVAGGKIILKWKLMSRKGNCECR